MVSEQTNKAIDQFLAPKTVIAVSDDGMESQECDLTTGECAKKWRLHSGT
jgi:hypothetical protein